MPPSARASPASQSQAMASLAKLTSVSTQTLSLLLERQRLQSLPAAGSNGGASSLHLPQITRNLRQLQVGIQEMESREGPSDAVKLLSSQYERMRSMLGPEADDAGLQSLAKPPPVPQALSAEASASASSSSSPSSSPSPRSQSPPPPADDSHERAYTPYTDDPEAGYSHSDMLQVQRNLMEDQDVHLDRLSQSINRQRDLSLQINDELEVHTGLLEGLDHDLDGTDSRMRGARRRLERVAKGAKANSSTVMIAILILVLLILIIVFKT